jgi:CRP/FNR family transcriptional regulator, dissimilatory nitrate respiration regulator
MDCAALCACPLFAGTTPEELEKMLPCLHARTRRFARGERVLHAGSPIAHSGIVLEGALHVEAVDAWGEISILESLAPLEPFALAYACCPDEPLGVDVVADSACKVLLFDAGRLAAPCSSHCAGHVRVAGRLVQSLARKSLALNRRMRAVAPRTIRGKLAAYLSQRAQACGASSFEIPFTQAQLASYLGVDRSALSATLAAMRREGAIDYSGRRFTLPS